MQLHEHGRTTIGMRDVILQHHHQPVLNWEIDLCICSRLCYSNGFSMRLTLKLYFIARELFFLSSFEIWVFWINVQNSFTFKEIILQKSLHFYKYEKLLQNFSSHSITLGQSRPEPQKWLDKRSKSIIKSAPFGICNLANNRKQWVSNSDRFFLNPSSLASCHMYYVLKSTIQKLVLSSLWVIST